MPLPPKMTIRADENWHRKIKVEAAKRGMTISRLVMTAVDEWLKNNPVKEANSDGEEKREQ